MRKNNLSSNGFLLPIFSSCRAGHCFPNLNFHKITVLPDNKPPLLELVYVDYYYSQPAVWIGTIHFPDSFFLTAHRIEAKIFIIVWTHPSPQTLAITSSLPLSQLNITFSQSDFLYFLFPIPSNARSIKVRSHVVLGTLVFPELSPVLST